MSTFPESLSEIAIVGMAGRFPGAPDLDTFWHNLTHGVESITTFTADELREAGIGEDTLNDPNYVRAKGVLDGGDEFDADFFGYSPREAEMMDPQHRVFCEAAWTALENAGCDPRSVTGRIGVFGGTSLNTYLLFNVLTNETAFASSGGYQTLLGGDKDFLATRLAYKLGLRGPAMTVQTACSTSLTAVHLACQSLLSGECDIALAGGVSVSAPLREGYGFEQGGVLSPDGSCRAFDADATGTVPADGVGVVVLRRLGDALADGDTVDAVICGTAVNNDGSGKAGYTAPSVDGQAEVIAEALAVADVDPGSIGYVEAHGTGTPLGDPIEVAALTRAFRDHTDATGYCAIGSVKSNIGHLDAAAGVTGLIKATLALKHEAIPPSLNCDTPNPALELETSPFFVNTALRPWPRSAAEARHAGVSSFGIGGTNVHAVLREAPPIASDTATERDERPGRWVLPLSAAAPTALTEGAARLADHLADRLDGDSDDLADVAYTLSCRRAALDHRRAVVVADREEAITALRRIADDPAPALGTASASASAVFLFPGQGSQYVGMARELAAHEPAFARHLDECATLFAAQLGQDLRDVLFDTTDPEAAARRLERTELTQPALFTVEYALARLWESWGVRPRAMVGHSIGEFTAACLAGVFDLADAVRLVSARAQLMQSMPTGTMLAVHLSEKDLLEHLGAELSLAAVNASTLSVVSGPADAVERLRRRLDDDGVTTRPLHTSHAFHSESMQPAADAFVDVVRSVRLSPPSIPFLSNVTGTWINDRQATSAEYWGRQLRETVRFSAAIGELLADPDAVFVEVGPGDTLATLVRQHEAWAADRTVVGSLPHPRRPEDERGLLSASLGTVWSRGVAVDWSALYPTGHGGPRRVVRLPGYAFQRRRYWIEPGATTRTGLAWPARTSPETDRDALLSVPGWSRLDPSAWPPASSANPDEVWVLFGADHPRGAALTRRLRERETTVVGVTAAETLEHRDDTSWALDPASRDHLRELLGHLAAAFDAGAARPLRFVHLWSLGSPTDGAADDHARREHAKRYGFDSLVALTQALDETRPESPVAVDVVTTGVHSVTGDEVLHPENAILTGATTVIAQELRDTRCRLLDLPAAESSSEREAGRWDDAVSAVLRTAPPDPSDAGETSLALRGRHWWSRRFTTADLTAGPSGSRLRAGGRYLVTGGLGGVGLALAEEIADQVEAPGLALASRSEFPEEREWDGWLAEHGTEDPTSRVILRLRSLRDRGARVVTVRGDVTDRSACEEMVRAAHAGLGGLNGVVHAAGLPSSGLLATKTPEESEAVFAAKTTGTLVLNDAVTEVVGDELDFMVLCSSLTGLLGGPGQSDYAGANAFLDVFAQRANTGDGRPVVSVAWDTWRDVGMAAGLGDLLGGERTGSETGHPLLRRVSVTEDAATYATTFSTSEHWIVADHRIIGHGLVPGTAYLELVRAAVAEDAGDRVVELHDIMFLLPVVVADGQTRTVYTTVERRDGGMRFVVRSRDGAGWREHATGSVSFHDRGVDTVRDLDEVVRECAVTEVLDTEEAVQERLQFGRFESGPMRFHFGPRWDCLRAMRIGTTRMLATLSLREEFHGDVADYGLHPALLDIAGAAARVHLPDTHHYLPLTYRSLRIEGALTSTVHCHIRLADMAAGETVSCDIEILDPEGRRLVEITDFAIKRINDVGGLLAQIEEAVQADDGEGPGDSGNGAVGGSATLRALSAGLSEDRAREAFTRILAAPSLPPNVVVSHRDVEELRALARTITPALIEDEITSLPTGGARHPRPALDTPYAEPADDTERAVAEIWSDVLGIDGVGRDDDFFALGGHSLAAVQIGAKVTQRFGTEVSLQEFFADPTIAALARLLTDAEDAVDEPAITRLSREADEDTDDAPDSVDALSDEEVEQRLLALLAAEEDEQGHQA